MAFDNANYNSAVATNLANKGNIYTSNDGSFKV
jgi:hypothetical protein